MTTVSKSIIVPCYNESANLPSLIRRFAELWTPTADWELVLVNNGSVDDSADVFRKEMTHEGRGFLRVVTVPSPNVGYGHGIVTGLRAARGEWLGWTHADGQTPPKDVFTAFDKLLAMKDPKRSLVKGRRRNRAPKDAMFTMGMQVVAGAILWEALDDINGQPKVFHRTLLDLADKPPVDLSLDLYFLHVARANGFSFDTIPVDFGLREHGESKWAFNWKSKGRNIARSVKFMMALRTGQPYPTA